ncbi:ATP-binding cassette domain-containing protein [Halothiobacillus sp. DCM-1]|uniref:ATP-binding cassette domain-containing protein n=1 Tax=Halothiobacillus sp. DCM-1 TaxID=3112558 RepID=UPI0032521C06
MISEGAAAVLQAHGVTKTFRGMNRPALQDFSLQVEAGSVTGLIGPDAAGKTTFLRLCCGLLHLDQGEIRVLDWQIGQANDQIQAHIGYMPQHFGLYEDLTVAENLTLYADLHQVPAAQRPARFEQLLHMTQLGRFTQRLAGHLSGGMKQKLGLACTLVKPPRLLLLDEPTVGVDPISRRELWDIVYQLVETEGMSVLLTTAYLDEAERCHQVVMLHEGKVLGSGAPAAFAAPLNGRVYGIRSSPTERRPLQSQLQQRPEVLDATIDRDHIRVLLAPNARPPATENPGWIPLAARFEDAFMDRLLGQNPPADRSPSQPDSPRAMTRPTDAVIQVQELTRRFGAFTAVDHLNFSVQSGEIFGLLGANGAGKSTTFRMLCGLLPASSGHLSVAGHDLRTAAAQARARIGYMSQKFALYDMLSVEQNLRFFGRAYGLRRRPLQQRIDWALDEFSLAERRKQNAGLLPLGFKQRLAMAAALLHEPDILFLDEPTSGVDPLERRAFWQRIQSLAAAGVTILITTHFMDEAEYCDRLLILNQGKILIEGSPAEVRSTVRSTALPDPSLEDAFIALTQPAVTAGHAA